MRFLANQGSIDLQPSFQGTMSYHLSFSLLSPTDDDGATVTVDRFDPGHEIPGKPGINRPTAKLPGDHVIPLIILFIITFR